MALYVQQITFSVVSYSLVAYSAAPVAISQPSELDHMIMRKVREAGECEVLTRDSAGGDTMLLS